MSVGRVLTLIVWFAATAAGQRFAGLRGWVFDPSNGGIAGATISVTDEETGFRRIAETEVTGAYAVASLRPGLYKISVRKDGFTPAVRFGVQLAAATLTRVDFQLPVGNMTETITVFGNPPVLEREDASTGVSVEREQIERLPLNGRGLLTLLELSPGTNVTPATRGEAGQFTATGQRPNANYFTIDGLSANTGVAGGGLPAQSTGGALPALSAFGSMDSLISLESVQELRVTTSTSGADMGRLPGANIALHSRSGTNDFHGTTLYRIRNELLSANNWFSNQAGYGPLPLRLQDFAQTFGGPIKHNRSFFLLSYEGMTLKQPYSWQQPVPTIDARDAAGDWAQPALNLFPAPSLGLTSDVGEWFGRGNRPASLSVGGVRFDQAIGSRVSLFARYNDSPSSNQFGTLAVNQLSLRSQSLSAGVNARPGGGWILDFRANGSIATAHSLWNRDDTSQCALAPLATFILNTATGCDYLVRFSIAGVGQVISGREGDRRQRQYQIVQTATWHHRSQTLTLGLDRRDILAVRRDATGNLGVIADTVTDLTGRNNLWIAKGDPQSASTPVNELSLWLQDVWQAGSRLTISAGLRWEYSPPPPPVAGIFFLNPTTNTIFGNAPPLQPLWPNTLHNFAPRLGIALRLTSDGRTVLRAGGGLYYDSSLSIATDVLNGGPLSGSTFTNAIKGQFASTLLTYGFMPGLKLPRVQQWSATLERGLTDHDVVSVAYVGAEGHDLIRRVIGGPGSSQRTFVALTTNNGYSNYQALQFQYRRTFARGLQSQVSYAWSHSIDNDSSDAFLVWAPPGTTDRGSSDFDVRHAFTAAVSYEFPRASAGPKRVLGGWAIDSVLHARNGFPVSVLNSEEYMGVTLENAFRPNLVWGQPLWLSDPNMAGGRKLNPAAFQTTAAGIQGTLGRNAFAGFGMWQVDSGVRREFRIKERRILELRVEAYNLLNHPNFADPIKYLNSPVFGTSTSMLNLMLGTGSPGSGLAPILQTGGPRSLQGSLRFQF